MVVYGRDLVSVGRDSRSIAAGATLLDTARWTSCTLDRRAGGAAFVVGRLLTYGGGDRTNRGVRGYTVRGRAAFGVLGRKRVWDVRTAGRSGYVRGRAVDVSRQGGTRSTVYVIDATSGKVLRELVPRGELVDVVSSRL